MAEPISIQQLKDASEDAITLADFIYKPANVMIPRRLAADINSLQYYLDYMSSYAQHSYETYDEMVANAPNLSENVSVFVTNDLDTTKNGIYTYNGTSFVKGDYQPENSAKDYVETRLGGLEVFDGKVLDSSIESLAYHPDTYARTQRSIRVDTVSLLDFIPQALHENIKNYAYTDDVKQYLQKAVNYSITSNKKLYVPAGGYMLDVGDKIPVYLSQVLGANKNFVMEGEGRGLTVFKDAAGSTTRGGRYARTFYFYYGLASAPDFEFGHIKISGITFDKNGRENTNDDVLYFYEQAAIIQFGGSSRGYIKSVIIDNVEFKDKIGGGLSISSSPNVDILNISCRDVYSREHPRVTKDGDGTYGQRGCIEISSNTKYADFTSCDILYSQVEPVLPSSIDVQRNTTVFGGSIDVFEFTDKGDYSFINIIGLTCSKDFLIFGMQANIINSTLKVINTWSGGIIKVNGGTILLGYDSETNETKTLLHGRPSSYSGYDELWLSNLNIKIDSADPNIRPKGHIVSGGGGDMMGSRVRYLTNVSLDSRAEKGIYAYGNGDWVINSCDISGTVVGIDVGGIGDTRGGRVTLIENRYHGTGSFVIVNNHNTLFRLHIRGDYNYSNFMRTQGFVDYSPLVTGFPTLRSPTKPTERRLPKGLTVYNSNPVEGSPEKWVKVDGADATDRSGWLPVGVIGNVT